MNSRSSRKLSVLEVKADLDRYKKLSVKMFDRIREMEYEREGLINSLKPTADLIERLINKDESAIEDAVAWLVGYNDAKSKYHL